MAGSRMNRMNEYESNIKETNIKNKPKRNVRDDAEDKRFPKCKLRKT